MQASAGGGISGAAARAAGPDFLPLRVRPEKTARNQCNRSYASATTSSMIVRTGSDRISEWRIMQETDSTSVSLNPEASLFVPALRASHPTDLSLEAAACLPAGSTAKSDLSDGDNVSVSTEASCLTDLSLETAPAEETCLSLFLLLDEYADRAATLWQRRRQRQQRRR